MTPQDDSAAESPRTFELRATIPYALRNAACAADQMAMRRLAANLIEKQDAENARLRKALEPFAAAWDELERNGWLAVAVDNSDLQAARAALQAQKEQG